MCVCVCVWGGGGGGGAEWGEGKGGGHQERKGKTNKEEGESMEGSPFTLCTCHTSSIRENIEMSTMLTMI